MSALILATEEQRKSIYEDVNATEESLKNDSLYLQEWMKKQPHLPNIEDTEWLSHFILRCKNSLERAKKQLDLYYTTKTLMPEVFENRDVYSKEMFQVIHTTMYIQLPKLTPDGHRVVIFRFFKECESLRNFSGNDVVKMGQIIADLSIKLDVIRGLILIYDFENSNLNMLAQFLTLMKKIVTLGTNVNPNRYKKIYLLNMIPAIEPLITLSKSFMKKKLADRVETWADDPKQLVKIIPKEVLPTDYGGDEKSLEDLREDTYNFLKEHSEWLRSIEKDKADISKKPDANEYSNNMFNGMEGSFRKITID